MSLPKTRTVRIIVNDPYATDSSNEDDEPKAQKHGPKKFITEVILYPNNKTKIVVPESASKKKTQLAKPKYRGVRQRTSGKWAAEIRDPNRKNHRLWLGTYLAAKEAAMAYDLAAIRLRGPKTTTNFRYQIQNENENEDTNSVLGFVLPPDYIQQYINNIFDTNNNKKKKNEFSSIDKNKKKVVAETEKEAETFSTFKDNEINVPDLFAEGFLPGDTMGCMDMQNFDFSNGMFVGSTSTSDAAALQCDDDWWLNNDLGDFFDFLY